MKNVPGSCPSSMGKRATAELSEADIAIGGSESVDDSRESDEATER